MRNMATENVLSSARSPQANRASTLPATLGISEEHHVSGVIPHCIYRRCNFLYQLPLVRKCWGGGQFNLLSK
jgi:hypothetical protein